MTAAHVHHHAYASFIPLVAMWQGMMVAMMTPVVWPWLRSYQVLFAASPAPAASGVPVSTRSGALLAVVPTASFAGGYFTAWLAFSVLAAAVQITATSVGSVAGGALTSPALRGLVLAAAGVYQFAPLKRACLTHCRNPLTYFLARWHGGPVGGFRLGTTHGLHCVGGCWALMLTALALGTMNGWWMAALAVCCFVEQAVPRGHLVRVPLGATLLIGGVRLALG